MGISALHVLCRCGVCICFNISLKIESLIYATVLIVQSTVHVIVLSRAILFPPIIAWTFKEIMTLAMLRDSSRSTPSGECPPQGVARWHGEELRRQYSPYLALT